MIITVLEAGKAYDFNFSTSKKAKPLDEKQIIRHVGMVLDELYFIQLEAANFDETKVTRTSVLENLEEEDFVRWVDQSIFYEMKKERSIFKEVSLQK